MPSTTTSQDLARIAADAFEAARRPDATDRYDTYIRVRDGSPEWVKDLAHHAHGEMFPDDWRYKCIAAACEHIADDGDPDDPHDFADQYVDVYTGARLEWLASHLSRVGYVDDAIEEYGAAHDEGVAGMIGLGQYAEASEVFGLVAQFLDGQAEDGDQ